jgi:hypothetical protein
MRDFWSEKNNNSSKITIAQRWKKCVEKSSRSRQNVGRFSQ